jgi:hypothetical protein
MWRRVNPGAVSWTQHLIPLAEKVVGGTPSPPRPNSAAKEPEHFDRSARQKFLDSRQTTVRAIESGSFPAAAVPPKEPNRQATN